MTEPDHSPTYRYTPADERRWIEGIRCGQMEAFDALYRAMVPALLRFAERMAPGHLAEDAVQDIMLDLWERRSVLSIQGSVRGYLFGAVRLRIADRLRRERSAEAANNALENQYSPHSVENSESLPSSAVELSELNAAVEKALASLPERSRLILTLRWIDGMSYPEIASILDISVDAAKKQGRRMEIALREILARFAPE